MMPASDADTLTPVDAAHCYADRGWRVVPIAPGTPPARCWWAMEWTSTTRRENLATLTGQIGRPRRSDNCPGSRRTTINPEAKVIQMIHNSRLSRLATPC